MPIRVQLQLIMEGSNSGETIINELLGELVIKQWINFKALTAWYKV